MNFLFSHIGRYLFWRTAIGFAIALGAVLASILLIDMVEQMRSLGDRVDLGLLDAARLSLYKTPMLIEQTLPFVVLAGAMIAIVRLNRSSELIALRASGVSAWRFLSPPALLAALLGVAVVTILNPIGANAYRHFEVEKARLLTTDAGQSLTPNGLWIRQATPQGQVVIHAERFGQTGAKLTDVMLLFFVTREGALRFSRRMHAAEAELKAGFWQLTDIIEAEPGGRPQHEDKLAIPTNLDPSELLNRFVQPATLSFWRLPGFIAESRAAGLAPVRYELKWQGLLAYPLMLAGMAGLGAVFSLRLQRLGNVAGWCAFGAGIGLFLFFFSQLSAAFAVSQAVPAIVASWSPPLAGMFTALAFVAYLEDG